MIFTQNEITRQSKELDESNLQVKQYLKEKFQYEFCTTCIKIEITAFIQDPALCAKYLGGQSSNPDYIAFVKDFESELQKFGPIEELVVPLMSESPKEEKAHVKVKFMTIQSAFCCYNLLNNKPYLGKPVNILFIREF